MITVTGLLDHAEEKQIVVPAVKKWLDELKDAAYEADDLLDEIAYEALRSELEAGSTRKKLCRLFSSHNPFDMAVNAKLEKILELLEYLTRQMNALVGIGGMGKTTLAQLVYNDKQDRHFNLKAWVYVSEEFNVSKITTEIRSKVSSEDCKANNLSELQQELKQKLEGKKYLLVLDDVWSDKYAEWESLLKPLRAGAQGSKIVVTTRIESIASAMENNQMLIDLIHPLEKLSDDDCWSMLATYAFHDEISNSSFKDVGKEIAKKCGGLPLALKTIGSVLRSKRNVKEWEKISQSNMWNLLSDNIVPALKLSYHYLPSHLKQCFAYCAVFPKGYEFYKKDLIPLWMAEGFIMEAKEGDDNEDVGDAYFKDLVSRSFFQMSSSSQNCFVMHDHMHDLAKSISGEFCFMLDKNSSDKVPTKTRYLYTHHGDVVFSYVYDGDRGYYKCIIEKVNESQVLRTFFSDEYFYRNWRVMPALLPKLKQLRVLVLYHYRKRKLPNSIGNLKHLRYLNLRRASIIKLPQSVSSLYNLQTLILRHCKYLVELPANLARLINLCCLDLRGTKLRRMPPQMGNLVKLRTLTNFSLGKGCGSGIMELGKLQHIHGELSIENLQNINPEHVWESKLRNKEQLKTLEFKWRGESKDAKHAEKTLEQLWPHEKVENIRIVGYDGTRFPYWVGSSSSSLSNLVCLKLIECNNCSCLPPLGQLASLKDLSITGFAKLVSVGLEFYGSCRPQ
ncbi:hypothetical protein GH714_017239 [Hevea brasiliensis]|uniref:NB-ARC domain-containing protein n=1 Tax=Hevea brasiliensis TaxID=3981 RepID=A0A6A6NCR2_HEVBR|nr:hypothetical protein GH714_017239 [Hevea brasiliensis]